MSKFSTEKVNTLTDMVKHLGERSSKTALILSQKKGSKKFSYKDLSALIERKCSILTSLEIGKGDKFVLLGPNSVDWIVLCLAGFRLGAVVVPVNVQSDSETLEHIIKDSGTRHVFTTENYEDALAALDLSDSIEIFMMDADERDSEAKDKVAEMADVEVLESDPAAIFYTSGTTGMPKGVPLTHQNLCHQMNFCADTLLGDSDQVVLLPLPLHHIYPFSLGFLLAIHIGATIVMPYSITGPSLMKAIKENSVTTLVGVPRLYSVLAQGVADRLKSRSFLVNIFGNSIWWLSSKLKQYLGISLGKMLLQPLHKQFGEKLELLACGGAAIDPELLKRLEGLGWKVIVGYGLSETSPLVSVNWSGADNASSAGAPIDDCEVRIADVDEEISSKQNLGEVEVRGPNVFSGYHHLEDQTRESFTEDGWFKTGDLGVLKDGLLYLKGRKSTVLVTESGENIQAEELESKYEESGTVKGCGILERNGKLVALVVPHRSAGNSKHEIEQNTKKAISRVDQSLPSYERLSDFSISSRDLPRTRLGKIKREKLSQLYDRINGSEEEGVVEASPMEISKMSSEDQNLLGNESVRRVWKVLSEKYKDEELTPDTNLRLDLGVDSLEWVNLSLEISNRTGLQIGEKSIKNLDSVRDLLQCCEEEEGLEPEETEVQIFESPEDNLKESDKKWLEPVGPFRRVILSLVYGLGLLIAKLYFRLEVEGEENLSGDDPLLIAPNHSSYLDPFLLGVAIPFSRLKNIFWAGYEGIAFANELARFGSRTAQGIPIDPFKDIVSSLSLAACVLKSGKRLVWFPEGERSHTGELVSFKQGIGLLSDRMDVPVIPVYIEGAHEALPPGSFFPKPAKVTVTFGEVRKPGDLVERGEGEATERKLVSGLKAELQDMIDERAVVGNAGSRQ